MSYERKVKKCSSRGRQSVNLKSLNCDMVNTIAIF